MAEWAEDLLEQTGRLDEVPEELRGYIDFDSFGCDAAPRLLPQASGLLPLPRAQRQLDTAETTELNGDIFVIDSSDGIHVCASQPCWRFCQRFWNR